MAERVVTTVRGDVSPARGHVLMHEHTLVGWPGSHYDPLAEPHWEVEEPRLASELAAVRERYGIELLVDAAPADLCRDVVLDKRIAEASGVDVVACTGFFKGDVGLPHYFRLQRDDELLDFMLRELEHGVADTGIRCGAIKVGTAGPALTEHEQRALRAAGAASAATGVAVLTHTDPEGWAQADVGALQLDELERGGADPARVAIGHVCGTRNVDWLAALCDRGAFVAFDRIGSTQIATDEQRAKMVAALLARGYGGNVLLSLDHQGIWRRRSVPASAPKVRKDFGLIHREFLPRLRDAGVEQEQEEVLLGDNPRTLLGRVMT